MNDLTQFNEPDNFDKVLDEKKITIRVNNNGSKKITFIDDWDLSIDELKVHLKTIKKKYGCNGTVKNKKVNNEKVIIFQLQGDKRTELIEYLKSCGIEETKINISGI